MSQLFRRASFILLFVASAAQTSMVLGQVDAIDEATVLDLCARAARKYELSSADGTRRFDLVTKSLLQWSKNTNEDVYGNVFIWTDQGVPAAVASIFKFVRPKDDLDSESGVFGLNVNSRATSLNCVS